MNILALDPATHCGFAHTCGASGEWDLSIRRDESQGMRLIRLRGKLVNILEEAPFNLLVFEAARHAAPKMQGSLLVLSELQSVIKVFCEDNAIEYRGYSPGEIKKHATGRGNSNKKLMVEAAKQKFTNQAIGSDNQADAL